MSKFKNSFEQLKKDPIKWRQDSWDKASNQQVKLLNVLFKSIYGFGAFLGFFLGFIENKKYFFIGVIFLLIFIFISPKKFKSKYGSKK